MKKHALKYAVAAATSALLLSAMLTPDRAAADSSFFEGAEETFVVFPTYAAMQQDGSLVIPLRAWVYEPEPDSIKRKLLVELFEEALDVEDADEEELFEERIRPFLYDNESGEEVVVSVKGRQHELGETEANGHVTGTLELPLEQAIHAVAASPGEQSVELKIRAAGVARTMVVPVVPRRGISVVSDIDDTIKDSEVLDREALLRNTFMEPFRSIDGMAGGYQRIDAIGSVTFHYLSASPWQLHPFLDEWRAEAGFPDGTYHLRQVRPSRIKSVREFVDDSREHKVSTIEQMLEHMPERRFVLIGDSGQHDPEIYGEVARAHPKRIDRIYIREVDGADNSRERFQEAFEDAPAAVWLTFDDPAQLFDSDD